MTYTSEHLPAARCRGVFWASSVASTGQPASTNVWITFDCPNAAA